MSAASLEFGHYVVSNLLPYQPASKGKGTLKTALTEYKVLLIAVKQAIEALKEGDFEKFDALVGENMCQIRAIKIALSAKGVSSSIKGLEPKVDAALKSIESLSTPKELHAMGATKITLKDLLVDKKLEVALTPDEMFFVQAYLLTLVKVTRPKKKDCRLLEDVTDLNQFKKLDESASNGFAGRVVKLVRKQLSTASVQFVQEQAKELAGEDELVSDKLIVEENDCVMLPFFFTNTILINVAMQQKIPIVISLRTFAKDQECRIVGKTSLLYEFHPKQAKYVKKTPGIGDFGRAAFVIEGLMCRSSDKLLSMANLEHAFDDHDVVEMFLANSASHRQYPDPEKDVLFEKDPSFVAYKTLAAEIGCTTDNPTLFCIDHVFCSKVYKQLPNPILPRELAAVPKIADTIFAYLEEAP